MKDKPPAFQFYPKDFLSDENVICMTLEEKGAYIILLCHCWLEGSIPSDLERIQRLVGGDFDMKNVLKCFTEMKNNSERFVSNRLLKEKKKQKDYKKKKSDAGKKGAISKWKNKGLDASNNNESGNGSAIVLPLANDSSSVCSLQSSSSSSLKHKNTARKKDLAPHRERFESVWKDYPEKKGKEKAWIKFKNQVKTDQDFEDIQKALVNYIAEVGRIKDGPQPDLNWKHGSTWFHDDWRDYVEMAKPETWAEKKKREMEESK